MNYKIIENIGSVRVVIELPIRKGASQKKLYCDRDTCLAILTEEGIEVDSLIEGHELVISNTEIDSRPFKGEWLFGKKIPPIVEKKPARRNSRAKKTQKDSKQTFRGRMKNIASKGPVETTKED